MTKLNILKEKVSVHMKTFDFWVWIFALLINLLFFQLFELLFSLEILITIHCKIVKKIHVAGSGAQNDVPRLYSPLDRQSVWLFRYSVYCEAKHRGAEKKPTIFEKFEPANVQHCSINNFSHWSVIKIGVDSLSVSRPIYFLLSCFSPRTKGQSQKTFEILEKAQ